MESNLFELLFLADAARRAGAQRITAVMPYFGYARQDRRATGREPVGVRLVADLLAAGRIDRVVALDLHSTALEGVFTLPLEHLSAIPRLADAARPLLAADSVLVAPDLGAAKLADRYATLLRLPVAIVHKRRVSGSAVAVRALSGEVAGRGGWIVDDMISTGATVEAAVAALVRAGCRPEVSVIATHALLVDDAAARLAAAGVERLVVADTVGRPLPRTAQVVSVAPLLADAIRRLHTNESLSDLIARA